MPGSWNGQDIRSDLGLGAFGTAPGITIYELPSGVPIRTLEEPGGYATAVSFTPDGTALAVAGGDGELHIYDTSTWDRLEPDGLAGDENIGSVAYHPDGSRLITVETTGDLVIRDSSTFEPTARLAGSGQPLVADAGTFFFDDSGRYLLTSGDGSAILWDLETEELVGVPFPNDPDFRIGGRDGWELLTAVGDSLQLWNLDLEAWPNIACQAAGRNLTLAEWEQFGPKDEPYRATCPQWPAAEEL
jgi:WD40 repeat protein